MLFSDVSLYVYRVDATMRVKAKAPKSVLNDLLELLDDEGGVVVTTGSSVTNGYFIDARITRPSDRFAVVKKMATRAVDFESVESLSYVNGSAPRPQPTEPISVVYSTDDSDCSGGRSAQWTGHDRNPAFESVGDAVTEMYSFFRNSAVLTAAVVGNEHLIRQVCRPEGVDLLVRPRSIVLSN